MSEHRPSRNLIYGLLDPRDACLRYVGKTHKRREIRLAEHIRAARQGQHGAVYDWIRELLTLGIAPEIFVIEYVPGSENWEEAERRQICFWRHPPFELPYTHPPQTKKSTPVLIARVDLTNVHEGGRLGTDTQEVLPGL